MFVVMGIGLSATPLNEALAGSVDKRKQFYRE
jgi:hypothetical protein